MEEMHPLIPQQSTVSRNMLCTKCVFFLSRAGGDEEYLSSRAKLTSGFLPFLSSLPTTSRVNPGHEHLSPPAVTVSWFLIPCSSQKAPRSCPVLC